MGFASAQVVITGLIEPCYDVGGDRFDDAGFAEVSRPTRRRTVATRTA
jgi:hypothetical protein